MDDKLDFRNLAVEWYKNQNWEENKTEDEMIVLNEEFDKWVKEMKENNEFMSNYQKNA